MSEYTTDNLGLKKPSSGSSAWGDDINENWETLDSTLTALKGAAPSTLDTLGKLATAIDNDSDFSTTVTNMVAQKAAQSDLDTHIGSGGTAHMEASTSASGFLPQLPGDSTKLFDGSGSWSDIPDTMALESYIAQLDATNKEPNLVFNGAMEVSQQNGTTELTCTPSTNYYDADGSNVYHNTDASMTTQNVVADSDTPFFRAVKSTFTTAATVAASNLAYRWWKVESPECERLKWGTPGARNLRVNLWVKANNAGDYSLCLHGGKDGGAYTTTFNISSEEVGQTVKKSVVFPGRTDVGFTIAEGTVGLYLMLDYGFGSTYQGTGNVWAANNVRRVPGSFGIAEHAGAYLVVTGVDAYADDYNIDREFPHKTYDEYLWDCQKWACWLEAASVGGTRGVQYSLTSVVETISLPVAMPRYNGIIIDTNPSAYAWDTASVYTVTGSAVGIKLSDRNLRLGVPVSSAGAPGYSTTLYDYKIFVDGRL